LNCPKCGKLVTDEKSGFCSECNTTLNTNGPSTDLLANAGLLTTLAAAFALTAAIVGIFSYQSYNEYFLRYYGYEAPNAYSFLIITGIAIAAAALGFLSAMSIFRKRQFPLTLVGPVLIVVSGIVLFIIEAMFSLGFSDGFTVPAVPAIVLSIIALVMISKSKQAFTDYNAIPLED
jgi:hypothetical protein